MSYIGNKKQVALYDSYTKEQADGIIRGLSFSLYNSSHTYQTGDIVKGSDGKFYEFYDRDVTGTVENVDPTNPLNRPHIWMEWDGVKPGATIEWRSETLPEGYVENDGAEISRADYRRIFAAHGTAYGAGDGSTTFQLPDDRGEFKRGWDHGRGVDAGRLFTAHQMDAMQGHHHSTDANTGAWSLALASGGSLVSKTINASVEDPIDDGVNGSVRTDKENRPRNNAVIYLTKI